MTGQPTADGVSPDLEDFDTLCLQCLRGVAAGSEKAMADLYDTTLGKVYAVAIRIVGDAATAEDVVRRGFARWR